MPALTKEFLFDFESGLQVIIEDEMARITKEMWASEVVKFLPSKSKREIVAWLLNTAALHDLGPMGGSMVFEDMVQLQTEIPNRFSGTGLKVQKHQFEDLDEHGIELGASWARQMGALFAYRPQEAASQVILTGETATGYDGKAFFAKDHPVNPAAPSVGTFGNLFSAAYNASTNPTYYAAPIDSSVTIDVAVANIWRVWSTIRGFKMPNGVTPRMLRPRKLLVPSALYPRAVEATNARFIAQAAGASGAGTSDMEAVITTLGFTKPIEVPEFAGVDNTSWYLVCEEIGTSQLGAVVYSEREPYSIRYYSGYSSGGPDGLDAILGRSNELEWQASGRNGCSFGHPYMIVKVKAA